MRREARSDDAPPLPRPDLVAVRGIEPPLSSLRRWCDVWTTDPVAARRGDVGSSGGTGSPLSPPSSDGAARGPRSSSVSFSGCVDLGEEVLPLPQARRPCSHGRSAWRKVVPAPRAVAPRPQPGDSPFPRPRSGATTSPSVLLQPPPSGTRAHEQPEPDAGRRRPCFSLG